MAEVDTALLVLRAAALLPENQNDRDQLLEDIAEHLGVEGEVDITEVTNISVEGTGMAARLPVSQRALVAITSDPIWDARAAELFLAPSPN